MEALYFKQILAHSTVAFILYDFRLTELLLLKDLLFKNENINNNSITWGALHPEYFYGAE